MLESFAPSLCLNGTPRQLRTLWHSMWDPVATVKTEIASHLPADGLGSDESVSIMRGPLEVGTEPYTFSSLSDAITITVQSPSDGGDASGHDTPRAFVADTGYSVEDIRATGSGYE
ncbi:hypothetical protein I317_03382 [Kwoniella heveanensis CBS 569]|nr:hypothetical protein I317_03382 [Kwoniella heveanensis CBS 569]